MPAKLTKQQFSLIVAIAVGCAVGNVVGRGLYDSTPTWLSIVAGSAAAVVVSLGMVSFMSLFVKP